ncbi:MAG TPA: substrate-binding domain-containing protein [Vicinamibacterales bacterium]|nr:substrate-binding domain-containing protein [Vicinamibacterales bacterium]
MCARLLRFLAVAFLGTLVACGGGGSAPGQQQRQVLRIGLLLDDIHERWEKDRELFIARAKEMGAEVEVRAAEGNHELQVKQANELLDAGVKALVVVPHDMARAVEIVQAAKQRNVPVVSYDRLIRNADIDLYASFDNAKVGEMQATYALAQAPKGSYLLIGGSPTDNNAQLIREGQMKVLEPAVKRGEVRIIGDPWADDWQAEAARQHTEEALKRTRGRVTAVLASNDGTAGGVIAALEARGLAGKVLVTGQDAELDALKRIVAGTQTMTVYKPIRSLANLAARNAVRLAEGEEVYTATTVNNGMKDVPAMLLEPIVVNKSNIEYTVISDGFQKREDVFGAAGTKQ